MSAIAEPVVQQRHGSRQNQPILMQSPESPRYHSRQQSWSQMALQGVWKVLPFLCLMLYMEWRNRPTSTMPQSAALGTYPDTRYMPLPRGVEGGIIYPPPGSADAKPRRYAGGGSGARRRANARARNSGNRGASGASPSVKYPNDRESVGTDNDAGLSDDRGGDDGANEGPLGQGARFDAKHDNPNYGSLFEEPVSDKESHDVDRDYERDGARGTSTDSEESYGTDGDDERDGASNTGADSGPESERAVVSSAAGPDSGARGNKKQKQQKRGRNYGTSGAIPGLDEYTDVRQVEEEYISEPMCLADTKADFAECLVVGGERQERFIKTLRNGDDLFDKACRKSDCLVEKHRRHLGEKCTPKGCSGGKDDCIKIPKDADYYDKNMKRGNKNKFGRLMDRNAAPLPEFVCDGTNYDRAIELVKIGMRRSRPVVLRKCALGMPSLKKWTREYLVAKGEGEFDMYEDDAAMNEGSLFPLPKPLVPDLFSKPGKNKFIDFLKLYRKKNWAWISKGGRLAKTHFDTFDNVHVLMKEKKDIWLGSPHLLPMTYMDFIHEDCADYTTHESGKGDVGCDQFGCYHFMPWDDQFMDFEEFPKLRHLLLNTTTLQAGDALFIPAYWVHTVRHYPLDMRGTNVAIAFVHQREIRPESRFSSDIAHFWKKHVDGKIDLDPRLCEILGPCPPKIPNWIDVYSLKRG